VIEDDVDDDAHAAPVRCGDEPIEVGKGAEQRIDGLVVGDVVAEIHLR
jgi:hypothetical protein